MATATFSVNGPNVGNYARSYALSDYDAGRVIEAWGAKFGLSNPQQIVDGIAADFLAHVISHAHEYHKAKDAKAAADAVQEIIATPT